MKSPEGNPNRQVARHYVGYFIDGEYREAIQVEYRYEQSTGFELCTRIQNKEYKSKSKKYFDALSDILDLLPLESTIVLLHQVIMTNRGTHIISNLEEWLYPYEVRNSGTVVYKLRLLVDQKYIETQKYFDFGSAAEDLRTQLEPDYRLKLCYFCKFLIEYNEFGGTDYRHDQIYCFRENLEDYDFLISFYPKLRGKESRLTGVPNMDALHGCEAFAYRVEPRP